MKTPLTVLAIFLAALCPAFAQDKPVQPDVSFFTKLRMDYAKRPDFNPMWKLDAQRHAILAAYKAKDFQKVADLSKAWLVKCPVDADIHFIRAQALVALGDIAHYADELYFFYGLIDSITSSGDGQSAQTAFKVISPAEEDSVLGDFRAEPIGQSLQGYCDVVRCQLPNNTAVTYYFDASIPLAAEAKEQAPKK